MFGTCLVIGPEQPLRNLTNQFKDTIPNQSCVPLDAGCTDFVLYLIGSLWYWGIAILPY